MLCGSYQCGCGVSVGDGLALSGSGESGDPFVIAAEATQVYAPVVNNAGGANVTYSTTNAGQYVRFGDWVFVNVYVLLTSSGSTGAQRVSAPFLPHADHISRGVGVFSFTDDSTDTHYEGIALIDSLGYFTGYRDGISPVAAMASSWGAGDRVRVSAAYRIAS